MNPNDDQPDEKEVYAYFGRCAYFAQVLEQGLVNLVVGLRVAGATNVTVGQARDAYEMADEKTMGALIADARKQAVIPAALDDEIRQALKDRNFLCHSFFLTHDADFGSRVGRVGMIAELETMTDRFRRLDPKIDALWVPLWSKFGVTDEWLDEQVAQRSLEARARDSSCEQGHAAGGPQAARG